MPNFNLIPPEEKERIENTKKVYIISGILKYVFIILVAFCLLLISTNFSFLKLINSQKDSLNKLKEDPIMKKILSLDKEIGLANTNISEVYKVQAGFKYLSPEIEKIINIIPAGAYITDLKIEYKVAAPTAPVPAPTPTAKTTNSTVSPQTTPAGDQAQQASFWEATISGHAETREQVISIEENLKKIPEFSNATSPLQNIIKPTDIDFTFTFRIKK